MYVFTQREKDIRENVRKGERVNQCKARNDTENEPAKHVEREREKERQEMMETQQAREGEDEGVGQKERARDKIE